MMDVGWKQSVGAFARVVLNVVLVLATLSRMGPKRERGFRGPNARGGRRTLFVLLKTARLTARFGVHLIMSKDPARVSDGARALAGDRSPPLLVSLSVSGRARSPLRMVVPAPVARRRDLNGLELWPETCSPPLLASLSVSGRARSPLGMVVPVPVARRRDFFNEVPERLIDFCTNTQEENDELLRRAALFGDALACFVLIGSGANVNGVDVCGNSPLRLSLLTHPEPKPDAVAKLLAAGAEVSAGDLHAAVKTQKVKVVQLLLHDIQARALPDLGRLRDFALQYANRPNVVKVLLRGGIVLGNMSIKSRRGNEAACALVDQIRRAGGWEEYARQHKCMLAAFVVKLAPLPDDAAGLVVDFYCPKGGYC